MNNTLEPVFNKNVLLATTMISSFFNPLMGAAVNIALPRIGLEFGMHAVELSWVTMAFLLSSAVFLLPLGKVGDMWGRKKMFLLGNVFLAVASMMCAFAPSGNLLIFWRLMQGIGSAMIFTTSMAMVISAFPLEERGKVIGLNVSAVYVGLSAAPVLGGFLTQTLGWRSLFIITGCVSLFIVLLVYFKINTEWKEDAKDKFDWKGSLIYMPSMTALMYGFSKLPSTSAIVYTILGVLGLLAFVRVEMKSEFPLLNMKLFFHNKVFAGSNLSAFINYAATFAVSFLLSLYLQYAKHLSPQDAGMILITQPILMAGVAMFSGRLSDKMNPRILASLGMAVSVVGLLMLAFVAQDTSQAYIIVALGILGFGFGLFSSPNTNMIMSSVEKRFYGVASATVSTMRSTGMMFSMAIATLSVHLFVGDKHINDSNVQAFIQSSQLVYFIFSALCVLGVFLSLLRVKK